MNHFENEHHLAAWACICPGNHERQEKEEGESEVR
ncbi:hypothetical protein H1S01_09285 [Heliobacterium chlorum]|uniref:Uncharacterized protein n=1 Tax=Heliobacterium chlorum TaxID=2698 RepID=A0ABR7T3K9_HELCL|nr:hypothetical protein [Heliobacterium chlorum]